jgi:hypothetical protein
LRLTYRRSWLSGFWGALKKGVFLDPREAVFVLLGEHEDLEPHTDLRQELLRRRLNAAINDPRPSIPAQQVFDELRKKMAAPLPEPAVWRVAVR